MVTKYNYERFHKYYFWSWTSRHFSLSQTKITMPQEDPGPSKITYLKHENILCLYFWTSYRTVGKVMVCSKQKRSRKEVEGPSNIKYIVVYKSLKYQVQEVIAHGHMTTGHSYGMKKIFIYIQKI